MFTIYSVGATRPGHPGSRYTWGAPRTVGLIPTQNLNTCQRDLYQSTVAVARQTRVITSGKPTETWRVLYTNVKCYIETGESQHLVQGPGIVSESDNIFTLDTFHFVFGIELKPNDILLATTGSEVPDYWRVRGYGNNRSTLANRVTYLCSREPTEPSGVF